VFEYFPEESDVALHDSRQHAIALAYTVVVPGECQPSQSALDFVWLDVSTLSDSFLESEMSNGQHHIVKSALSYLGVLR
jgi:hypothetical protein